MPVTLIAPTEITSGSSGPDQLEPQKTKYKTWLLSDW